MEERRALGIEALCDEVIGAVKAHRTCGPAEDDLTLLVLEFHGADAKDGGQ
jgi:hypothetical protein